MATRSRIAIEKANGTVESIYCHWDGYPEYNGEILENHYTDDKKVQSLIDLGDISSLRQNVEAPEGHSFECPDDETTVAYGRDRGEKNVDKIVHPSVQDFFDGDIEEYGYLFTQEGEWLVKSAYGSPRKPITVADALEVI
jgi:hypothetical protein